MKNSIIYIALLFPFISWGQLDRSIRPQAAKAATINIKDSEVFKTANGITVILSENHKLPKVSFSLTMGASPVGEGSKAGLSSLAGDLILSGTDNRSKDQLDNEKDNIGASLSASSRSIYLSCLTKHMSKGLDLMSDVLMHANFPQAEFERMKNQYASSLMATKSNPNEMASNAVSKVNFPVGHPKNDVMTQASLDAINLSDVVSYYKSTFVPEGSYLVVVGDINKATVLQMIDKYFASWKGSASKNTLLAPSTFPKGNRVVFVKKEGAVQSLINVTFPILMSPGDSNQIALGVMNNILGGGGFGTRMMKNLREDKAYTYGCYSSVRIDENGSSFSASGNFRNEVTDSALIEILKEIELIGEGYVSDEELDLTKKSMAGSFAQSLESPQTIARFALNIIKYNLDKDYYKNYLKKLEGISKEDVLLMAQTYLKPSNCNIVIVGNESVLEKLKQFDADGKIELFDAFGSEAKEMVKADISADALIQNYLFALTASSSEKAMTKKLKKIKSVYTEVLFSGDQLPGVINSTRAWMSPNKEGEKVEFSGMALSKSYFDGKTWKETSQGKAVEHTANEMASKNKKQGLFPEMNYKANGVEYTLLGIEKLNNEEVYVLKIYDGTNTSFSYFSKKTMLKVKEVNLVEQEGEMHETSTEFADYTLINGVLFPQKMNVAMGPMILSGKVSKTEINKEIDFTTFQ
jgi:zinc protease